MCVLCLALLVTQEPKDLFEVISQCLLAAVDRDCLAGWGGVVHVM
jgi:20S proteasome subunit beta 3